MPGICGFFKNETSENNQISNMTNSMLLTDRLGSKEIYSDDFIELSQVSLKFMKNKPLVNENMVVYIEGEGYNLDIVQELFNLKSNNFEEILAEAHETSILPEVLNKIDGHFNACLYDKKNKKIFLISDRWGMRFMYWYFKDNKFAFSGEVKGILALEGIDKTIKKSSLDCFLDLGFLLGENTWFENIKLIKPATIIEFDINSKQLKQEYYWKFSEIKQQNLPYEEAVEKLCKLLVSSVEHRFDETKKIAIPISGGLDSRAIIAVVNKLRPKHKTFNFTFGTPNCEDIIVAKKVCKVAKQKHVSYCYSNKNWFDPRIKHVWYTDGLLSFNDMHGSEFADDYSKHADYLFSGYAGDAVCGETFKKNPEDLDKRITPEIAAQYYGKHTHLADIDDDFYDTPHFEPHLYLNRVRRFTNMGLINVSTNIEPLIPFFDNEMIEFIFSIPDKYRAGNRLYTDALLKAFPDFYSKIIWQRTGELIKPPTENIILKKLKQSIKKIFYKTSNIKSSFHDYDNWMRDNTIANKLKTILNPEKALYTNYTPKKYNELFLKPHLAKRRNHSGYISRAITIELYLQQVFNGHDFEKNLKDA